MIKHFLNPPNWFTSASLFCSTYAMALLMDAPHPVTPELVIRASILVIFAGVFDLLDGRVARMTRRFSEFGVQLDTIADVVGFGVAPALLAWAWKLHELGTLGAVAIFWYVLCAAFRLARFNVNTVEQVWGLKGHSQGLTTTMAGGALVSLIWVCNGTLRGVVDPPPWLVAGFLGWLGLMMVSSIPFRNFKDIRQNRYARRWLAFAVASCLVAALVFDPSMWWGAGAVLYLGLGFVDGIVVSAMHRRLSSALLIDEIEKAMQEGIPTEGEDEEDHEEPPQVAGT